MNLLAAKGQRTRWSWEEVQAALGMEKQEVHNLVYRKQGAKLIKRYRGTYPFDMSDVNQFITHFNAGKVEIGVRR